MSNTTENPPARVIYKAEFLNTSTGETWLSAAIHEVPETAEIDGRKIAEGFGVSQFNRVVKFKEEVAP
jgi:hypothetical protein